MYKCTNLSNKVDLYYDKILLKIITKLDKKIHDTQGLGHLLGKSGSVWDHVFQSEYIIQTNKNTI